MCIINFNAVKVHNVIIISIAIIIISATAIIKVSA